MAVKFPDDDLLFSVEHIIIFVHVYTKSLALPNYRAGVVRWRVSFREHMVADSGDARVLAVVQGFTLSA